MKKNIFEIYLTTDHVTGDEWLRLFLKISKINGRIGWWNFWIHIENNYIRYFVETKRTLPPIVGELGEFLFKKTNMDFREFSRPGLPFFLTKNYKTLLDVYDRYDTRKSQKIRNVKITFFNIKYGTYLSTTHLYLKDKDENTIKIKAFWNDSIYDFVSVNFSTHIRFFYQKSLAKYLDPKKVINILSTNKENAILEANVFPYLQDSLYLNYKNYDFAKHSLVIGASGTGKSKFICSMIKNLSQNINNKLKYKVIVIDPHASIEDDIGGLDNTEVIDFKTDDTSINLFENSKDDVIAMTEAIMSIFKNLIADRYNSKLERVLRYSIHILLENEDFNLINLRKLLVEIEYRNELLKRLEDTINPNIVEFFRTDFNELKTKSYQEAIAPIVSFIDELEMIPALNNTSSNIYLKNIIKNNFLSIISLDQTSLGLSVTKTIAGFAMQQILQLVQSHSFDEHIILVIDEVALIENPILIRFLSEARKYNLSLILAGQFFDQISENLQKSIFTNVVNYFTFRVSRLDAIILEKNMQMEMAVKNSIFNRLKMLTELSNRECVVRVSKDGRMLSSFKGKTLDFISVPRNKNTNYNKKIIEKVNNIKEKIFNVDTNTSISLNNLMKQNSSSRKKVNFENE